ACVDDPLDVALRRVRRVVIGRPRGERLHRHLSHDDSWQNHEQYAHGVLLFLRDLFGAMLLWRAGANKRPTRPPRQFLGCNADWLDYLVNVGRWSVLSSARASGSVAGDLPMCRKIIVIARSLLAVAVVLCHAGLAGADWPDWKTHPEGQWVK